MLAVEKDALLIAAGKNAYRILRSTTARTKRAMDAGEFIRGYPWKPEPS